MFTWVLKGPRSISRAGGHRVEVDHAACSAVGCQGDTRNPAPGASLVHVRPAGRPCPRARDLHLRDTCTIRDLPGHCFCFCFFFKPGRVCVFLACSSGPGSLFSDLGFISNPSSDRLVFINVFFPSINSHGYSLQLVMIKKCKEPPFNLTQSIAILTSVTQEGSDAGRGA